MPESEQVRYDDRPEHHAPMSAPDGGTTLTPQQADILDFEMSWWKYTGAKEGVIREKFDMSATRYYQALNALLDNPAALAHDPMTVRRLRRIRTARREARETHRRA